MILAPHLGGSQFINFSPAGTVSAGGDFLWPDGQLQAYQVWEARNSGETATSNGEGFGFGSVQFVIFQLPSGWRQVVP